MAPARRAPSGRAAGRIRRTAANGASPLGNEEPGRGSLPRVRWRRRELRAARGRFPPCRWLGQRARVLGIVAWMIFRMPWRPENARTLGAPGRRSGGISTATLAGGAGQIPRAMVPPCRPGESDTTVHRARRGPQGGGRARRPPAGPESLLPASSRTHNRDGDGGGRCVSHGAPRGRTARPPTARATRPRGNRRVAASVGASSSAWRRTRYPRPGWAAAALRREEERRAAGFAGARIAKAIAWLRNAVLG